MSTHKTAPNVNAFPRMFGNDAPQDGLTKREYFAAMALQGLLAYSGYLQHDCVVRSVRLADQLIIELNKTN